MRHLLLLGIRATGARKEAARSLGILVRHPIAPPDDLVHRRNILRVLHHRQALVVALRWRRRIYFIVVDYFFSFVNKKKKMIFIARDVWKGSLAGVPCLQKYSVPVVPTPSQDANPQLPHPYPTGRRSDTVVLHTAASKGERRNGTRKTDTMPVEALP